MFDGYLLVSVNIYFSTHRQHFVEDGIGLFKIATKFLSSVKWNGVGEMDHEVSLR